MTYSVLVAFNPPDRVADAFRDAFDVDFVAEGQPANALDVMDRLAGRDALVVTPPTRIDAAAIAALPASVTALATYSVGLEHLDLDAARQRNLPVLFTPDVLSDSVAEIAIFLMLGAARRATESIDLIRSRQWVGWRPRQLVGLEITGKTLGVLGMGRIGQGIAARARGLGMTVHYHNRRRLPAALEGDAQFHADAEEMLKIADVLVVACPLTPQTHRYVNAERIALMKPTAVVVNIARGDIIHDDALIDALANGRLHAAGLDVFAGEPAIDPRYYDLPNAFILPHVGSATIEARMKMGRFLIDGLHDLAAGRDPANRVA